MRRSQRSKLRCKKSRRSRRTTSTTSSRRSKNLMNTLRPCRQSPRKSMTTTACWWRSTRSLRSSTSAKRTTVTYSWGRLFFRRKRANGSEKTTSTSNPRSMPSLQPKRPTRMLRLWRPRRGREQERIRQNLNRRSRINTLKIGEVCWAIRRWTHLKGPTLRLSLVLAGRIDPLRAPMGCPREVQQWISWQEEFAQSVSTTQTKILR